MFANSTSEQVVQWSIRDNADLRIAISKLSKQAWMVSAQESDRAVVSTIMAELGTNMLKYAEQGDLTVSFSTDPDCVIEVRAQDRGPGIADVSLAMQDHYTTLGLGLPGVKRMADSFYIASSETGTTVVATKSLRPASKQIKALSPLPITPEQFRSWDIGSATLPMTGQIRGGDIAVIIETADNLLLVLVDVTGHGDRGHILAKRIKEDVEANNERAPIALMSILHENLRGTIGAAVGILAVDCIVSRFTYVGVGNTGISRVTGEPWSGISRDGLLGARLPNLTEQCGTLTPGDAFLLWTDGVPERLGRQYLAQHSREDAQQIARDIVKAHGKGHDDAGCIVLRWL
jgi:anti-sigma regulatory factor (Ser/Thr protein kinase)